jgi:hypothetical protein
VTTSSFFPVLDRLKGDVNPMTCSINELLDAKRKSGPKPANLGSGSNPRFSTAQVDAITECLGVDLSDDAWRKILDRFLAMLRAKVKTEVEIAKEELNLDEMKWQNEKFSKVYEYVMEMNLSDFKDEVQQILDASAIENEPDLVDAYHPDLLLQMEDDIVKKAGKEGKRGHYNTKKLALDGTSILTKMMGGGSGKPVFSLKIL